MSRTVTILSLCVAGVGASVASAGVTATTDTNITTWGAVSPTLATRTYLTPDVPITAASNVPENLASNRIVAQTFRISNSIVLDKVALLVNGAAGTYSAHLYNITGGSSLGGSYKPSTDGPVGLKGVDLLASGSTFTFNGSPSAAVLLTLDFDGLDEVALPAQSLDSTNTLVASQYALELWPTASTTTSLNWIRGGGGISTYSSGDGYEVNSGNNPGNSAPVNSTLRTQLAGSSRDLVLGVYAVVPEPTSMTAIAALSLIARRRRTA